MKHTTLIRWWLSRPWLSSMQWPLLQKHMQMIEGYYSPSTCRYWNSLVVEPEVGWFPETNCLRTRTMLRSATEISIGSSKSLQFEKLNALQPCLHVFKEDMEITRSRRDRFAASGLPDKHPLRKIVSGSTSIEREPVWTIELRKLSRPQRCCENKFNCIMLLLESDGI